MKSPAFGLACLGLLLSEVVLATPTTLDTLSAGAEQYLAVSVERVVIDTDGLVAASNNMASSIDTLALAIEKLARQGSALTADEKKVLLNAVQAVDRASVAVAELAQKIPQTARDISQQLPQVVKDAKQPIAEISHSLQAARDGVYAITEALPQATENTKALVNSTLNAALLRLSIFAIALMALMALIFVWAARYIYRSYLDPIAAKLEPLTAAPEHFSAMALHMHETSANLLALQKTDPAAVKSAASVVSHPPAAPKVAPQPPDTE